MPLSFYLLTLIVLAGATAAMALRNLIHCALALALTFVGLAGLFLQLNAQFVGLAQILVYVGAVSILMVFAILLTRAGDSQEPPLPGRGLLAGGLTAIGVFSVLAGGIGGSHVLPPPLKCPAPDEPGVAEIGHWLMSAGLAPLLATGLLLTAALIGALLLAMRERPENGEPKP